MEWHLTNMDAQLKCVTFMYLRTVVERQLINSTHFDIVTPRKLGRRKENNKERVIYQIGHVIVVGPCYNNIAVVQ